MYNPYRGRYTYAPQSGGGTRYARLPPVIEIIPRWGIAPHLSPHSDTLPRSALLLPLPRGALLACWLVRLPFGPVSLRWWHSLRSLTTGYRNNTPVGVYPASHSPYHFDPVSRVGPLLSETRPRERVAATPEGLHLDNRG